MKDTFDPLTETLAEELAAVRNLADQLHDRLYTEPAPGTFAQARSLVEARDVHNRLAHLADLLEGNRR